MRYCLLPAIGLAVWAVQLRFLATGRRGQRALLLAWRRGMPAVALLLLLAFMFDPTRPPPMEDQPFSDSDMLFLGNMSTGLTVWAVLFVLDTALRAALWIRMRVRRHRHGAQRPDDRRACREPSALDAS